MKNKKILRYIIMAISMITLIYSLVKIVNYNKDHNNIKKQVNDIKKVIKEKKIKPSNDDKLINEPPRDPDNDYWNYIKLPLYSVDFDELLKINKETVGFLKVNGTNINYPVVKTKDNKHYLNHSFNNTYNEAGWVFMDYRNNQVDLDDNTIVYGHGRIDTTMFGTLKNVFKNDWYKNTDNYVINYSSPTENTLWQIFSIYKIPTETYYLTTNFQNEIEHKKFIDTIHGRSTFKFNATVDTNDKILTLSTCLNDDVRVVLHAKLIKKQ